MISERNQDYLHRPIRWFSATLKSLRKISLLDNPFAELYMNNLTQISGSLLDRNHPKDLVLSSRAISKSWE